jgi:toxin secretion/phage lysis holin
MKMIFKWLSGAAGACCAWLCWALGGWDGALQMMFLLMGLDLMTGVMVSVVRRSDKTEGGGFLSSAFFLGLSRKLMMLALVMLATALDGVLGSAGVSRVAVIGFYAANEGLSIVENGAVLGVPFPKAVLGVLERMREKEAGGAEE